MDRICGNIKKLVLESRRSLVMKFIYILSVLPFVGILGFLPFVNRVTPFVLGMPFNMFWMVIWVVLTSIILGVMYKLDPRNREGEEE